MDDLEKEVKSKIDDLEKRVAKNQGKIILTFRNIYTSIEVTGDFIPPKKHYRSYFETGVINGNLETGEKRNKFRSIHLPSLSVQDHSTYFYSPNIFVSVDRKLSGNSLLSLLTSPIELSKAKKDKIDIDSLELLLRGSSLDYSRNPPYLEDFGVFIGDKEIIKFVLSDKSGIYLNNSKKRVSDFLNLMKNHKEIEKRVKKEYLNMRERLAGNLVREVNDLSKTYKDILEIEERVLKLHLERIHSGMEDMSSSVEWNDRSVLEIYTALKMKADESFEGISELLKEADEIDFVKHPRVSGKNIGFPAEIKPQDYLNYINRSLLPSIRSIEKKLDKHLADARKVKV